MENLLAYNTILAFWVWLSLWFILGLIFARILQKTSLIPIGNTVFGIIFVGVNLFSVVYWAEIPYIFNFMLAMAFGWMLGIDLVKYLPSLQNLWKK
jgi:hypothetical protein